MINIMNSILEYFLNPRDTIERIANDSIEIEKLAVIGTLSYLISTTITLFSRVDTGFLGSILVLISSIIYGIFVIGFALVIGKTPSISTPKVLCFLLSLGIIDLITITLFPISIVVSWILNLGILTIIALKIYYLIYGISRIFNIPKSSSILIILSPYIIFIIALIVFLFSSYTVISGALESL